MNSAVLWGVALSAAAGLATLLARAVQRAVVTLVEKSVSSRFEKEIEAVRSDLRLKESKISALQSAVISGRAGRQALMDKRRIDAVDTVWRDVIRLDPFLWPAQMTQILKLDAIAAHVSSDPKLKTFMEVVSGNDLTEKLKELDAETVRPFLPVEVWALYSAYKELLVFCFMRIKVAAIGVDNTSFKEDVLINKIKNVVPHFSQYLETHGLPGAAGLANILRDRVLDSLKLTLKNLGSDMDEVTEIHDIMKKVGEIGQEKAA